MPKMPPRRDHPGVQIAGSMLRQVDPDEACGGRAESKVQLWSLGRKDRCDRDNDRPKVLRGGLGCEVDAAERTAIFGNAKSAHVVCDMAAAGISPGGRPRQESSDPLIFEPNCWINGPIASGTELAVVTVASIG